MFMIYAIEWMDVGSTIHLGMISEENYLLEMTSSDTEPLSEEYSSKQIELQAEYVH